MAESTVFAAVHGLQGQLPSTETSVWTDVREEKWGNVKLAGVKKVQEKELGVLQKLQSNKIVLAANWMLVRIGWTDG